MIFILLILNVGKRFKDDNMKAVVINETCKAEDLKVSEIEIPKIKPNWVLVKVKSFGINRSEIILREYEADEDYINLPIVPGIECVGEIIDENNSKFNKGDLVIGLMGGMGRSFNGTYEEYTLLPEKNVFKVNEKIKNNLSIEEIASIPETYFTAYGSLFESLNLKENETILIRGGTSTVGLAACKLAKAKRSTVIATSRKKENIKNLLENGADYGIIDDENLKKEIDKICPNGVDKILELIGPETMEDSMKVLKKHGICCVTGILGGIEYINQFDPIKYIPNGKCLTSFFSNYPNQEIIDNIFNMIIDNHIKTKISKVYTSLEDIKKAHKLMETNKAQGKIVFKIA